MVILPSSSSAATVSNASIGTKLTEPIVASYTISAPIINLQKLNDDRITTSFTISSPQPLSTSTTSASATINVPASMPTSTTKKTDTDMLSTKASPTNVQTSFIFTKNNADSNQKLLVVEKTSIDNDQHQTPMNEDCVISLGITDDDKNDKINTVVSKASAKRSLFDIDNASSLSLADKLRNEANKYSELSSGRTSANIDVFSASELEKQNKKSDSTPTSPTSYQPPSINPNLQTSERRPSWRLKLDAGSKVRIKIQKKNKKKQLK